MAIDSSEPQIVLIPETADASKNRLIRRLVAGGLGVAMLGGIGIGLAIGKNRPEKDSKIAVKLPSPSASPSPDVTPTTYVDEKGFTRPINQDFRKEQNRTLNFEPKYAPVNSNVQHVLDVLTYGTSRAYSERNYRYLALITEDWEGQYAQIVRNRIDELENYYDITTKYVLVKDWGMVTNEVWRVHADIYETVEGGTASGKTTKTPVSIELVRKTLKLGDEEIIRSGESANTNNPSWELEYRDAWVIRNQFGRDETNGRS